MLVELVPGVEVGFQFGVSFVVGGLRYEFEVELRVAFGLVILVDYDLVRDVSFRRLRGQRVDDGVVEVVSIESMVEFRRDEERSKMLT